MSISPTPSKPPPIGLRWRSSTTFVLVVVAFRYVSFLSQLTPTTLLTGLDLHSHLFFILSVSLRVKFS